MFSEGTSDRYIKQQLAKLVLEDAVCLRELQGTFDKIRAEGEQDTMDAIQHHFNSAGLYVKHAAGMSWVKYNMVRRVLSYAFEPPSDPDYSNPNDIGKYERLAMPSGVKMAVLPTRETIGECIFDIL